MQRRIAEPGPGNDLRAARMAAGLSLTQFARAVDVSVSCASRWETDLRRPHSSDLTRIALLLGRAPVDVAGWFAGTDPLRSEALRRASGLRRLRARDGLSRAELAGRIGVSAATVAHWECGRRALPAHRLRELGQVFGVSGPALVTALAHEPIDSVPRLVQFRRRAGLTQSQVGRRLGVTNTLVCAWERGRARPSWPQMRRLARLYRCELPEIAEAFSIEVPSALHPSAWTRANLHCILRDVRIWRGETREQIARRLGVHGQTVARWERGLSVPAPASVVGLERALGLRAGSLPVSGVQRRVG